MATKADYLKKYADKPKKKKDKKPSGGGGLRIVDQDIDIKTLVPKRDEMKISAKTKPAQIVVDDDEEDGPVETSAKFHIQREDGSGWTDSAGAEDDPRVKKEPGVKAEPRSQRHDSPEPAAPRKRMDSPDMSPRRGKPADSPKRSRDLSPPRARRHDSPEPDGKRGTTGKRGRSPAGADRDQSPPRKRARAEAGGNGDLSPPRRSSRHESPARGSAGGDLSPPRRGKRSDLPDPSSDRAKVKQEPGMDTKHGNSSSSSSRGGGGGDGIRRHGLVDADEFSRKVRADLDAKNAKLQGENSGKGAETIVRDRRGRKLTHAEALREGAAKMLDEQEGKMEWGKGLVQDRKKEDKRRELDEIRQSQFARGSDDSNLNALLKDRDRWGDPMLAAQREKEKKQRDKAMKERDEEMSDDDGEAVEDKPKRALIPRPVYHGAPWLNRFNIKPGYRWDGVERGTGYEEARFKFLNERESNKLAAFMWSQSDM